MIFQMLGITFGDDPFGLFVQHDDPVCYIKNALKFVGYDNHCRPEALIEMYNKVVEFDRGYGIESGRRLVKK